MWKLVGVGAFKQEKVLVGAFSVIVKTDCETDGPFAALPRSAGPWASQLPGRTPEPLVAESDPCLRINII